MSFSAQFTAAQSATGTLTIIDESDYSLEAKNTFTYRVVKLFLSDGTLFTGAAIPFTFSDHPTDRIDISDIDRDYAFTVELALTSSSEQTGSTYSVQKVVGITAYTRQFIYRLLREIAANPSVTNKANYYQNFQELYTELQNTIHAVTYNDAASAQCALDRANKFIKNKTLFF